MNYKKIDTREILGIRKMFVGMKQNVESEETQDTAKCERCSLIVEKSTLSQVGKYLLCVSCMDVLYMRD